MRSFMGLRINKQAVVVVVWLVIIESLYDIDDVSPTFMAVIVKIDVEVIKTCRIMYDLNNQCYTDDYQNLKWKLAGERRLKDIRFM